MTLNKNHQVMAMDMATVMVMKMAMAIMKMTSNNKHE